MWFCGLYFLQLSTDVSWKRFVTVVLGDLAWWNVSISQVFWNGLFCYPFCWLLMANTMITINLVCWTKRRMNSTMYQPNIVVLIWTTVEPRVILILENCSREPRQRVKRTWSGTNECDDFKLNGYRVDRKNRVEKIFKKPVGIESLVKEFRWTRQHINNSCGASVAHKTSHVTKVDGCFWKPGYTFVASTDAVVYVRSLTIVKLLLPPFCRFIYLLVGKCWWLCWRIKVEIGSCRLSSGIKLNKIFLTQVLHITCNNWEMSVIRI